MRRARAIVIVTILAALLAACGGGTNLVKAVAASPEKTTATKSAKFSATITSDTGPFAKGLDTTGEFDFAHRRGHLQLDPSGLGIPGAPKNVEAVIDFSSGFVEYVHFPQLAPELGGKEWLKLDVASLLKQLTCADITSALQSQSADPSAGIQQLRGATAVTKVGSEKVRGVKATHYRAIVDVQKSVDSAPASARADMQKLVDLYTVKTFPIDVWLDSAGRVVRQTVTLDTSTFKLPCATTPASASLGKLTVTTEFYDFGTAVNATPPPADATADFNELLKQAQSQQQFQKVGSELH